MYRNLIKKILSILMIIAILATDFFVLGSNLITYASQNNSETNNSNIEFSAYFKNENGKKIGSIEKSIKSEDLKLYARIDVKNEGYFNGTIEIKDSNFNLKRDILSTKIASIEGNKVHLKQINAGETVEIELGIEPIISEQITKDMLTKTSTVKITGTYMESTYKGLPIQSEKLVNVNYLVDEKAQAELETDIITNKVFSVEGKNQRIVQLLIKSRLTENEYPVEQTVLTVGVPKLGEERAEISILALEELATNGLTEITKEDYTYDGENLKIILKNNPQDQTIRWKKDAYDKLIVTLMYSEDADTTNINIKTKTEITVYNSTKTYNAERESMYDSSKAVNNIIFGKTEITTKELYKGQLYANTTSEEDIEIEYQTQTTVVVTKTGVMDNLTILEKTDVFEADKKELLVNSKYVSTQINKEKMLEILGADGNIEIINGKTSILINKDTETNQNGTIIINYQDSTSELKIISSKPVKEGILEIRHKKVMTENRYTREQLKPVKTLKTENFVTGTITINDENKKVLENHKETSFEIKETVSKAELTIENGKENLSTTEINELRLGIALTTDNIKYDLFKNPKISILLPQDVESVTVTNIRKVNDPDGEFGEPKYTIREVENNKILDITLQGEQKSYPSTELYITVDLTIILSQLATIKTDKIKMAYTNENASQYYGGTTDAGVTEQNIGISAQHGLLKMFNLSSNADTSLTNQITQLVSNKKENKSLSFETILINNTESDINNVKIFGKLPTTGVIVDGQENTLQTTLIGTDVANAKIKYTDNTNAKIDSEADWVTDFSQLQNPKLYLIELETLSKGSIYKATINIEVSDEMIKHGVSYTEYEVIYDETEKVQESRKIALMTSLVAGLENTLTAQVGQENLKSGDRVKEGEVIKYIATVKNTTDQTLENVQLKAEIPEGTVLVEPVENYVYTNNPFYYQEKSNIKEKTVTIPTLSANGGEYTLEYEVRVKTNITAGREISNKSTVIYDGSETKSAEFKNVLQQSNVRVTIKRADDKEIQLLSGGTANYNVYIENLSNKVIRNLKLNIITDNFEAKKIDGDEIFTSEEAIEEIDISEIPANGAIIFDIYGKIKNNVTKLNISASVEDANGNYRSNKISENLPDQDLKITLSSSHHNKEIKENDIVKYSITIQKVGNSEEVITLKDEISDYLEVQEIKINESVRAQTTNENDKSTYYEYLSNEIDEYIILQEKAQIEITCKVKEIASIYNDKIITNKAYVYINEICKNETEEVKHILKSNSTEVEQIKNVISGLAWLDSNENGQKDNEEMLLPDINVKLYDSINKNYLTDDNGNILETLTDTEGEYYFTNINQGSYIIIFEYDTEKYELTTYLADGVDTTVNSKVIIRDITIDGEKLTVSASKTIDVQENISYMNIGLKEKLSDSPEEDDANKPEDPNEPDEPVVPDNPDSPETPEDDKKEISGFAWIDLDRDGEKDDKEPVLKDIKVKIYNISAKEYIKDNNGNILQETTDAKGKYKFTNLEKGSYIVLFEYNTEEYEPTIYLADGIDTGKNSKAVLKKVNINGEEIITAVTDIINLQQDVYNINIGLREKVIFDLELNKYISKIVVQNSKETKSYDYENETFAKVEIHRKRMNGSLVVLEYTIKVKNNGECAGYAKNIVDYLPSGLTFNSELNADWYLSGNYLYTKGLENIELQPGEEKEIKLILTKTMTNENVGLMNNRAEIYQDYNKYGEVDIDSTPNNQSKNEDDMGSVDVIIVISTGGSITAFILLLIVNITLIGIAIVLIIKKEEIKKFS